MQTNHETVRLLCKSIITRLENLKAIAFAPQSRSRIQDEVFTLLKPSIMTEEDFKEKALEKVHGRADALQESGLSENEHFKTAKSMVRGDFGQDELNGLYFQKSLRELAQALSSYFMSSSHIEEVYETDADLELKVVDLFKRFDPKNAH